ncbi:sensor domain-containing diguanylate cyclase [Nocardia callitridis]|uniref:PAS domain S-box-containing protein/diguanylate cyclase (GGDEF)-like protein n=1 Tax=Nocardia callitridis TaxID=648753 RepID=A0ABP9KUS3_9NOCA
MGSRELAVRWADALDGAVAPTLTRTQVENILADLCGALSAVVQERADLSLARDVATVLVAANYRDAVAVSRSVSVICRDLVRDLCPDEQSPEFGRIRDRAVVVAAEFAAGFTGALRAAALSEQQATLAATVVAAQEAESRRQLWEARFEAVFAGASVGIGTVDITGRVLDVNAALAEMLGMPAELMPGRSVGDLIGPAGNTRDAYRKMRSLLTGEIDRFRFETDHTHPDGTMTSIDLSLSSVRDSTGRVRFLIGVAVDVTERKQLADRLWHDANHDSLTGLPNRGLFFDRLAKAMPPVGACYLDLDGFKAINDHWGHSIGDGVLRLVGRRLQAVVEPIGGLVARLGGDEFIVLIEKCASEDHLADVTAALRKALTRPMGIGGTAVSVGASIGTVFVTDLPSAPDQLMHAADAAMYREKNTHARRAPTAGQR